MGIDYPEDENNEQTYFRYLTRLDLVRDYIDDKLRASSTIDGNLFFYKERFIDWFKRGFLKDEKFLKNKKEG